MQIVLDTTKGSGLPWVSDEYGRLIEVAMCKLTYYDWAAENAIVAASKASGAVADRSVAEVQHAKMAIALEQAGVVIRYLEADPHLPMQTFARDSAVMTPWGILVCQMARQKRRGEWVAVERLGATLELPIWQRVTAAPVEGGDVQVVRPGEILIGVTPGYNRTAPHLGIGGDAAWIIVGRASDKAPIENLRKFRPLRLLYGVRGFGSAGTRRSLMATFYADRRASGRMSILLLQSLANRQ